MVRVAHLLHKQDNLIGGLHSLNSKPYTRNKKEKLNSKPFSKKLSSFEVPTKHLELARRDCPAVNPPKASSIVC